MTKPPTITSAAEMRQWADAAHAAGERIGLVPTMGYLHEGHLSLVREARKRADRVVVSIFVNPTQFGPTEDLESYPRDLDADLDKLGELGVDVVFAPEEAAVYPPGFGTYVLPDQLARRLCGTSRPTHFRGVATIVSILLRIIRCHVAVFGQKDYQQLQIIRRMVRDLWLDVEIIGAPIVREPDGLAMSSRNGYLSETERRDALALSRALARAADLVASGEHKTGPLLEAVGAVLAEAASVRVEYAEIVDAESLEPIETIERPAVCALAVFVGTTRLIDNRVLEPR